MARAYVSSNTVLDYDDFVAQRRPADVAEELAAMRSLVVEFRQSLEDGNKEAVQEFFEDVARDLQMSLRMTSVRFPELSREISDEIEKCILAIVKANFARLFPAQTRLTGKDAETMSKLLRNIVESAEKYQRIFNGITIGLNMEPNLEAFFQAFVVKFILPNVGIKDRLAIANAVMEFLPQLQAPSTGVPPMLKVVK